MNRFDGILNAPPQKRYRNFVSTSADWEQVWLYKGDPWCVWAEREFAVHMVPEEQLVQVDVHDFCNELLSEAAAQGISISVFPNGTNSQVVSAEELREALLTELERIE